MFAFKETKSGEQVLVNILFVLTNQIYMFYGVRTNAHLLVNQGFVYQDNDNDTFQVYQADLPEKPASGEKESEIQGARVKYLQHCGVSVYTFLLSYFTNTPK